MYGVETLAEQQLKLRKMNLLKISTFYQESTMLQKTLELIKSEFKKGIQSIYDISEDGINSFGYTLLAENKKEDALEIFKLNTELYRNSFNTFDSLGECLLLLNRKQEGIEAYKKSLELNPKNENAKSVLEKTK